MRPGRLEVRLLIVMACTVIAAPSLAVIIDSGNGEGNVEAPPEFPWWGHVQQRLAGPSTIYMGNGWVLTAKHVGMGILLHDGEHYAPAPDTLVEFGTTQEPADLILFRMDDAKPWPDLPFMEITRRRPHPGEDVIMIGSGRNRGERIAAAQVPDGAPIGWHWGPGAQRRWGTNRVADGYLQVDHSDTSTRSFATVFDSAFSGGLTMHEGQAAAGDSGGGVFSLRDSADPSSGWVLAGVMFTVNHAEAGPVEAATYGDSTHSADLSVYRDDILSVVRPACYDEQDDDADGLVDHPADPGCESRLDDDERDPEAVEPAAQTVRPLALLATGVLTLTVAAGVFRALRAAH